MAETTDWRVLWSQASSARSGGKISHALGLFDAAIAAAPATGEPFAEAGGLCDDTARSLVGVGQLYDRHRAAFGLAGDGCPAAAMHEAFVHRLGVSAVSHLLRAVEFAPGHAAWHARLAETLERSARPGLALAHRRRAAQLVPTSLRAAWRLADALEAQDRTEEAVALCRSMRQRWPWGPSIALRIARLLDGTADPEGIDGAPHEDDTPERHLGMLLETAQAVAGDASKADEVERRTLLATAEAAAARMPDSCVAQLALGYAALAVGRRRLARRTFLAASLLQARGVTTPAEIDVSSAMSFAQALIVDPELACSDGAAAPPDGRVLALAHAGHCRAEGEVFEALRGYGEAVAGYVLRSTPFSYELYKDYKILGHEALYYGIPARVARFRIIDGVVCHASSTVDQARHRVPGWVIDLARRINRRLWRLDRGGMLLQPSVRLLRRLVARLYAVPGVQVADTHEALVALIDRVPEESPAMTGEPIVPLDEEPWVRLAGGSELAGWSKVDEIGYNQRNRQAEKYLFFRRIFDFLNENEIRGDYHEYGCHRGRTFRMALTEARRHNLDAMTFWAFDSFEGLPVPVSETSVGTWTRGALSTSQEGFLELVRAHGVYVDRVRTVKGFYADSLTPALRDRVAARESRIALATIDCDLYESAVPVFDFIAPLLQTGSVLYLDDLFVGNRGCPSGGVARAFIEFRKRSPWRFIRHLDVGWWGRSYIACPADAAIDDPL